MEHRYDYLVVGSGIAGLTFALSVAHSGRVAIVTKLKMDSTTTNLAQGGIASVISDTDSFENHVDDTIRAGAGLCDRMAVETIVRDGPEMIRRLISWGVEFSRNPDGNFDLTKEGGHSQRRILHTMDATGQEIERALISAARHHPNISLFEHHIAVNLITDDNIDKRCIGAYVLNINERCVDTFAAPVTALATGGAGKVYLYTSNPDIASGDGMAIAYRAGARIANMEFVQFHPTCLFHPEAKSALISEALRGEGAKLKLRDGSSFMERYDARHELATRDIVARAIDSELKRSGAEFVLLDARHMGIEYLEKRFPRIVATCRKFNIDPATQPIPVVPAAHYFCGGIETDIDGRTNIAGLYACGEVASTGLHGANRLASNSLLESVVMAARAAKNALDTDGIHAAAPKNIPSWNPGSATNSDEEVVIAQNWHEIRLTMWNYVGIVRSDKRLQRALSRIEMLQEEITEYYWDFTIGPNIVELRNLAMVAELVIRSALSRKESRGLHYNIDHPNSSDSFLKNTVLRSQVD